MKIALGGYRRMRVWYCGMAGLAVIVAWFGAAIRASAGEEANDSSQAVSHGTTTPPIGSPVAPAIGSADAPAGASYVVSHPVKGVLHRIQEERGLRGFGARRFLEETLKSRMAGSGSGSGGRSELNQVTWGENNEQMLIDATRTGHKQIAEMLNSFNEFGLAEIVIETRFVTIPNEDLEQVLPNWMTLPLEVPESPQDGSNAAQPASFDCPLGRHEGTRVARAQYLVEKNPPVRFRVVDEELGAKLIDRCQSNGRANVLQAPKTTVFNGQIAIVSDLSQTPFVTGVQAVGQETGRQAFQPQIRIVSEGVKLQLRPITEPSGAVHMDFAVTFSQIHDVATASFARNGTEGPTVQIPEVSTVRTEGGALLKQGQWILLGSVECKNKQEAQKEVAPVSWKDKLFRGGKQSDRRDTQTLILMLRADRLDQPQDPLPKT